MGQSTNMKMPFQTNIKETHISVSIAAVFCERVDALTGDSFSSFIFNRRFAPSSPPGEVKNLLVAPSLKEKEEKVMRGGIVKLTEFCNN